MTVTIVVCLILYIKIIMQISFCLVPAIAFSWNNVGKRPILLPPNSMPNSLTALLFVLLRRADIGTNPAMHIYIDTWEQPCPQAKWICLAASSQAVPCVPGTRPRLKGPRSYWQVPHSGATPNLLRPVVGLWNCYFFSFWVRGNV